MPSRSQLSPVVTAAEGLAQMPLSSLLNTAPTTLALILVDGCDQLIPGTVRPRRHLPKTVRSNTADRQPLQGLPVYLHALMTNLQTRLVVQPP